MRPSDSTLHFPTLLHYTLHYTTHSLHGTPHYSTRYTALHCTTLQETTASGSNNPKNILTSKIHKYFKDYLAYQRDVAIEAI